MFGHGLELNIAYSGPRLEAFKVLGVVRGSLACVGSHSARFGVQGGCAAEHRGGVEYLPVDTLQVCFGVLQWWAILLIVAVFMLMCLTPPPARSSSLLHCAHVTLLCALWLTPAPPLQTKKEA